MTRTDSLRLSTASAFLCGASLLVASCSSNSGASSTKTGEDFAIADVSVTAASAWKLNRPIDIEFNQAVDFSTVSLNTINIGTIDGRPATGSFSLLPDGRTVRFLATCPTLGDSSDAGLLPGGREYRLHIVGASSSGVSVRSAAGESLEDSFSLTFFTPDSEDPQALFLDTVSGPPSPLVRGRGNTEIDAEDATYLELGDDPDNRMYFVWNSTDQIGELEDPDFLVPLNLYSEVGGRVAVVLYLNQPINPDVGNISTRFVQLEYLDAGDEWRAVGTRLSLSENCSEAGAAMRLEPIGVLPQGSGLRVIIREGFGDLVGDKTLLDTVGFADMTTRTAFDPGTIRPGDAADELFETFLTDELEDKTAAFATPPAAWGEGFLAASFPFGGNGGPGANFDWHIPPGVEFILDTNSTTITGGPGGEPTSQQAVINGVVNVRNLFVPANSSLRIQGPNICTILATGEVTIEGVVSVNGASNRGVGTLGTANLPEPGASGNGGGGRGGTASFLTNQSTPRGGQADGALGQSTGGGQGGESCYATGGVAARRAAGGGGGAFGPDVFYAFDGQPDPLVRCQELIGLDGEPGFGGGVEPGKGAESQSDRAQGGAMGRRPFFDESDENDFFGKLLTAQGDLIIGELDRVWAGGGGGAGGDAVTSDTFPLVPFTPAGDEKGSGGGGAAGGLRILALGPIEVRGPTGSVTATGGQGGGGENTNGFNRVGGGSGGGSGGHLVFSSASYISIEGEAQNAGSWFNDATLEHFHRPISAAGGQGGAGHGNKGGARQNGQQSNWRCDAIPTDYFLGDNPEPNPPRNDVDCWTMAQLPDLGDPLGNVLGAGGDGTPGIIQFHVDDPATNLRFPDLPGVYGAIGVAGIDASRVCAPPPLGWKAQETGLAADIAIPFFGKESSSRSQWTALGLARVSPDGGNDQVRFRFEGTDASGELERTGSEQSVLPPILGPDVLGIEPMLPHIDPSDALTMVLDASPLMGNDDSYKRNAALLRSFVLRLEDSASSSNALEFDVASAVYDEDGDQLRVTVFAAGTNDLSDLVPSGNTLVSLQPFFTRVNTAGGVKQYPADSSVTILFEATLADSEGNPDEGASSGEVPDITALNLTDYDFFRYRVLFDMSTSGEPVNQNTPRPSLEFLRVPFRF